MDLDAVISGLRQKLQTMKSSTTPAAPAPTVSTDHQDEQMPKKDFQHVLKRFSSEHSAAELQSNDANNEKSKQEIPLKKTYSQDIQIVDGKEEFRICFDEPKAPAAGVVQQPLQKRLPDVSYQGHFIP